jgi:hypothetical protein
VYEKVTKGAMPADAGAVRAHRDPVGAHLQFKSHRILHKSSGIVDVCTVAYCDACLKARKLF